MFTNGNWSQTTDPRLTSESAEGTTVTTVGAVIYASQTTGTASPIGPWNQWALNANAQILLNGTIAPNTASVVALVSLTQPSYSLTITATPTMVGDAYTGSVPPAIPPRTPPSIPWVEGGGKGPNWRTESSFRRPTVRLPLAHGTPVGCSPPGGQHLDI